MPDPVEAPGPRRHNPVRALTRPPAALGGVILFQLLFASAFVGVLHHPVLHRAPVAVAATAWRRRPVSRAPQRAAQAADTATAASLAS